jgi:hypothetical protein
MLQRPDLREWTCKSQRIESSLSLHRTSGLNPLQERLRQFRRAGTDHWSVSPHNGERICGPWRKSFFAAEQFFSLRSSPRSASIATTLGSWNAHERPRPVTSESLYATGKVVTARALLLGERLDMKGIEVGQRLATNPLVIAAGFDPAGRRVRAVRAPARPRAQARPHLAHGGHARRAAPEPALAARRVLHRAAHCDRDRADPLPALRGRSLKGQHLVLVGFRYYPSL